MQQLIHVGTVSWGTHRLDHLWENFRPYLPNNADWVREGDQLYKQYIQSDNLPWDQLIELEEQFNHYVNTAFDYMESIAPEGYYFGAHPGDGSDYGFWPLDNEYYI